MDRKRSQPAEDKLVPVLSGRQRPSLTVFVELLAAWRAAAQEEHRALRAWQEGRGDYSAFVAALDREDAAARVLAEYSAREP